MLNRRHLRIKVLQILYAFFQSEEENILKAEKELLSAVERMYDMYLFMILTLPELKRAGLNRMEEHKKKMRPSEEDLNPNMKFVQNVLVDAIEGSNELTKLSESRKVNWLGAESQEIFRKLYLSILESEVYFEHMNNDAVGFEEDMQFALQLFKSEIANSELIQYFFEEKSIYWADDLDLCCSMAMKTMKTWTSGKSFEVMPLYKENDDEKEFIVNLLRKTIQMNEENESLITELTQNWELDRIAKMDIILLKMGLTELQTCSSIPTKVTLNEYIEISKFYSTPKSNLFINGVLDKAIIQLTKDKKIVKIGRGLIS
ncbi:MAG: transcription antitermination factor NusB [Bacteroidota bacterium]|jgi:N utilization substance protein B